jgi:hypothetical protein
MGLGVPVDMDGRVLTEIFNESEREVEELDMVLTPQSTESFLTQDEENQIKEKLKGWGYL